MVNFSIMFPSPLFLFAPFCLVFPSPLYPFLLFGLITYRPPTTTVYTISADPTLPHEKKRPRNNGIGEKKTRVGNKTRGQKQQQNVFLCLTVFKKSKPSKSGLILLKIFLSQHVQDMCHYRTGRRGRGGKGGYLRFFECGGWRVGLGKQMHWLRDRDQGEEYYVIVYMAKRKEMQDTIIM